MYVFDNDTERDKQEKTSALHTLSPTQQKHNTHTHKRRSPVTIIVFLIHHCRVMLQEQFDYWSMTAVASINKTRAALSVRKETT